MWKWKSIRKSHLKCLFQSQVTHFLYIIFMWEWLLMMATASFVIALNDYTFLWAFKCIASEQTKTLPKIFFKMILPFCSVFCGSLSRSVEELISKMTNVYFCPENFSHHFELTSVCLVQVKQTEEQLRLPKWATKAGQWPVAVMLWYNQKAEAAAVAKKKQNN